MNDFVSYNELVKLFDLSGLGLKRPEKRQSLVDVGDLEAISSDGKTYYSIKSMETYLSKIEQIRNDYYTIGELIEKTMGSKADNMYYGRFLNLCKSACMDILIMEIPPTISMKYLIKKSSYEQFVQNYISIADAHIQLSYFKDSYTFTRYIIKENYEILTFLKLHEFMYIKKDALKDIEKKLIVDGVSVTDAQKILIINTPKNFYEILREYSITSYLGRLSKQDLKFLLNEQEKIYTDLEQNYYSYEEITSLSNEIGTVKVDNKFIKTIRHNIPHIAQIKKFDGKISLFEKIQFDQYLQKIKKEKEISQILNSAISDYYHVFLELFSLENVSFSEDAKLTKELWFKYVNWKLSNQSGNYETCIRRASNFCKTTTTLINFIKSREIFEFSEMELNLGLFSLNVPKNYRKELFIFISTANDTLVTYGKKLFDLKKIDPKLTATKSQEKEVYSIDEYISLHSFVCDYERHKKLAIKDVRTALTNKKKYRKYDSFWLFVLLHINNGWRRQDIIEFPRLSCPLFDKYNLTSIESLENLQLTYIEAEKIVNYYRVQWFEHNKTKEKAEFYCSSVLTIPMAYAILICEFRCRSLHVHDEKTLIHFYTKYNTINPTVHNTFFEGFIDGFRFESRKMNRTVLTLMESVINATAFSTGDPIEIARHLRGHTTKETTNGYIVIPQQHLDFITKQLFDTGYFGYIYDQVGKLLIAEAPETRTEQTQRSITIRELLGDVVKLEDMSSYLLHLSQEREDLGKYLDELPKEELQKKMNLINLGLSPAKEESYQCFFAQCIASKKECSRCAFSIPHFYSLTVICERIKRIIDNYRNALQDNEIPEGELNKLYNILIMDYIKVREAKQKFGVEIVESFLDMEFKDFDHQLKLLPDPQYI